MRSWYMTTESLECERKTTEAFKEYERIQRLQVKTWEETVLINRQAKSKTNEAWDNYERVISKSEATRNKWYDDNNIRRADDETDDTDPADSSDKL